MTRRSAGGWALAAARVGMGAFFLYEASNQLRKGWIGGDGLERMIRSAIRDHGVLPPYRYLLEHVVIEHDQVFTLLAIAGEIAVGLALVAGLLTRATAAVALGMNIAFLLLNGATFGGLIDAVFIVLEVVLIVFAARQAFSVDGVLAGLGVRSPLLGGPSAASPAAK